MTSGAPPATGPRPGGTGTRRRLSGLPPESIAGAIYGTIVVAGVLAAEPYGDEADAVRSAATALGTVVVFWIAHGWAHYLARRATEGPQARLRRSLAGDWPLVQAAVPPLVAVGVSVLAGAADDTAIEIAEFVCTAVLVAWGALIAVNERASLVRVIVSAAVCGMLGLVMIGLKVLVH